MPALDISKIQNLFLGTRSAFDQFLPNPSAAAPTPTKVNIPSSAAATEEALKAQRSFYQSANEQAGKLQGIGENLWKQYQEIYQPGTTALARQTFAGIPAEQEVGRSVTGVTQQFGRERDQFARTLERMGVDPSSPRYQFLQRQRTIAEAAARAGAANQARQKVQDVNYARRMQMAQLGAQYPGQVAALGTQASALQGQAAQGFMPFYQNSVQAEQAALAQQFQANQAAQAFANQLQMQQLQNAAAERSALYGGLGQLAGIGIGQEAAPQLPALPTVPSYVPQPQSPALPSYAPRASYDRVVYPADWGKMPSSSPSFMAGITRK